MKRKMYKVTKVMLLKAAANVRLRFIRQNSA